MCGADSWEHQMPVPASIKDRQRQWRLAWCFMVLELEFGTCCMLNSCCAETHTHPRSPSQVQLFGNLNLPCEWTLLRASVTNSLPITLTVSRINNTAASWIHSVLAARLSDSDMSYQWTEEGCLFFAFRALSCHNRSNDVFKNSS